MNCSQISHVYIEIIMQINILNKYIEIAKNKFPTDLMIFHYIFLFIFKFPRI